MLSTERPPASPNLRQALLVVLLGTLAWICVEVLHPFINPVVWAAIITYVSWPAFRRVKTLCGHRPATSAFVMTILVTIVVVGPLLLLGVVLLDELSGAYRYAIANGTHTAALTRSLRSIPGLGDFLRQALDRLPDDPIALRKLMIDWAMNSHDAVLGFFGSVVRNIAKLLITLITTFFIFRHGPRLVQWSNEILAHLVADRGTRYVGVASVTVRAVVFGFLVTAVAQGVIAGVGYAVVGADAPVALGALTIFAAIVPVIGTGLVWGAVAVMLLMNGHFWPGIALLAWGTVLVHPVDNVLRPLLISKATQVPFLLVMFGVIGGIAAFGLVGLFVGPVALAVAIALWREWRARSQDLTSANAPLDQESGV